MSHMAKASAGGEFQSRRAGLPLRREAMSERLEGKTAIITGSTEGIGLGIAPSNVQTEFITQGHPRR